MTMTDERLMRTLRAGAAARHAEVGPETWRPMPDAPRNGLLIEVRCTAGIVPWYGLYHWITNTDRSDVARWARVDDESHTFTEGPDFTWRPYHGDHRTYRDPTNGLQDDPAYWRGATADQYGLRLDAFEKPELGYLVSLSTRCARWRAWWQRLLVRTPSDG